MKDELIIYNLEPRTFWVLFSFIMLSCAVLVIYCNMSN